MVLFCEIATVLKVLQVCCQLQMRAQQTCVRSGFCFCLVHGTAHEAWQAYVARNCSAWGQNTERGILNFGCFLLLGVRTGEGDSSGPCN